MTPEQRIEQLKYGQKFHHYKGGMYTFLHIGRHSETEEWFVIYKNATGDVWVRPYYMFFETVILDGQEILRFTPVFTDDPTSQS